MAVLPDFVQPFFTWLTGMPLANQSPLFLWTPLSLTACTTAELLIGLLVGIAALSAPLWVGVLLLPISWILTTGAMRMFFVVIEHACTHHSFSSNRIVNRAAGDIISTLLWAETYKDFKHEHAIHHRVTRMPDDPDAHLLNKYGFYAGMSRDSVTRQLVKAVFSPRYHIEYFAYRAHSNLRGPAYRIAMFIGYVCALLYLLSVFDLWWYWLVLWAFPAVVLFQASLLINTLTEHRWSSLRGDRRQNRVEVCFGRFCGEYTPAVSDGSFGERAWRWSVWWARVVFVHLPYRLFVLVGDSPQHDLHHLYPASDWANAKYVRLSYVKSHEKSGQFTDEWGSIVDHINACSGERDPSKTATLPGLQPVLS